MKRRLSEPRRDWQSRVERFGLTYHTTPAGKYWDESAYYELTAGEVDKLEAATLRLQEMCLAAGQAIIDQKRFEDLAIPAEARHKIVTTWYEEPPALYGRFDLAFNGDQVKLLEYNADTPTGLVEAAIAQWYWLQDTHPNNDQWNSIHEKLIDKWKDLKDYVSPTVHFGYCDIPEDSMTVAYLRDTAEQAGLDTKPIIMKDIGWDQSRFVDGDLHTIGSIFKLYPWEWMIKEQFGTHAINSSTLWIEPIWKMMFSNKGLLAILWELYPNDDLLLPAYIGSPKDMTSYVKKPLLGREGSNVQVVRAGVVEEQTFGPYGEDGFVYQEYFDIPQFDGNRPVLGSWMIDQDSAGVGIRETNKLVADNLSRFIPHLMS